MSSNSYNSGVPQYQEFGYNSYGTVNGDNARRRLSGNFSSNGSNASILSRRGSRDMTHDMKRVRNEDIRQGLLQELEIVTIPAGSRLNLWDNNTKGITNAHFVSSGDLQVLIKRGHGPMYKLLQQIAHPESATGKFDNDEFNQIWDETKEAFRSMPIIRNLVDNKDHLNDAITMALSRINMDVDAILMAYDQQNRIGLYFVNEGIEVNHSIFLQ